jgi:uncharacterized protein (TIGR02453 family)
VATVSFRGFPAAAISFFEGLAADNSRDYWTANKAVYERAVKGPMAALIEEVDERYRPMRMFRPNRDVRFSADKSPYKTNIAAVGEREGGAVYYVHLSADGLYAGSGYYSMATDQLDRFRRAVVDDVTGAELTALVAAAEKKGCGAMADDELKTAPRGYAKDHPRVGLLRRKGLGTGRGWPVAAWLGTAKARDRVEEVWRAGDGVNDWLDTHVGPTEAPPDPRRAF